MKIERYEQARAELKERYEAMKKHLEFRKKLWDDYEMLAIEYDNAGDATAYAIDGERVDVETDRVLVGNTVVRNVTEMKAAIVTEAERRKQMIIKYAQIMPPSEILPGLKWLVIEADDCTVRASLRFGGHQWDAESFDDATLAEASVDYIMAREREILDSLPQWFVHMGPADAKALITYYANKGTQSHAEVKHKENVMKAMLHILNQYGVKYTPFSVGQKLSYRLKGHAVRTMALRYKRDYMNRDLVFTLKKDTGGNRWDVMLEDGTEMRLQLGFNEENATDWWVASAIRKDHVEYNNKYGAIDAWYKDNEDVSMAELLNAIPEDGVA